MEDHWQRVKQSKTERSEKKTSYLWLAMKVFWRWRLLYCYQCWPQSRPSVRMIKSATGRAIELHCGSQEFMPWGIVFHSSKLQIVLCIERLEQDEFPLMKGMLARMYVRMKPHRKKQSPCLVLTSYLDRIVSVWLKVTDFNRLCVTLGWKRDKRSCGVRRVVYDNWEK